MAKRKSKPKSKTRSKRGPPDDYVPMTDRELFLRVELSFLHQQLKSAVALKHLPDKEKEGLWITPERHEARLNYINLRAFDQWIDLCNDNCKSMYFCSKKKGHKGQHGTDGLVWD